MNVRAVIWDLDGVIADTGSFHFRAWRELAQGIGLDFSAEDFQRVFGLRNADIIRTVLAPQITAEDLEALAERKEKSYRAKIRHNIKPLPGVLPLLHELREMEFKLAVASSTAPTNIELVLSSLGIRQMFHCLVSGQDVDKGKPDPEVFLLAAAKLGAEPDYCVVIEDAIKGIEAAKAAGMKCIAVANTHPQPSLAAADLVVDSLEAVTVRDVELLLQ